MKKVFALLMIAGVFAMASCGKKEQAAEATVDSTAATEAAAPAVDSAAAPAGDSTAAATDTAAAAPAPAAH